jgi:hypothetical protein
VRNRHRALALAAGMLVAAAAPAVASATTYCVHLAGACAPGQIDEGTSIQQALDDAAGHTGLDIVDIGPGSYPGEFTYPATDHIQVRGAGAGQTVLTGLGTTGGIVMNFASGQATVSDLSVRLANGNAQVGLVMNVGTVERVAVDGTQSAGSSGIVFFGPGLVAGSDIEVSGAAFQTLAGANPGTPTITDSRLAGSYGVIARSLPATVRRVRIEATTAAAADGAELTVENSLLQVPTQSIGAVVATCSATGPSIVRLDGVTLVGPGSGTAIAANCGATGTALAAVNGSIVTGFATRVRRESSGGDASATITSSDLDLEALVDAGGPGTLKQSANVDVDPGFVSATDFHLRADSPLIDYIPLSGTVGQGTDLDGNPRAFGPGVDLGAYERQGPPAPAPVAAAPGLTAPGAPPPAAPVAAPPTPPTSASSTAPAPTPRGACARRGGPGYAITWPAAGRVRIEWRTSAGHRLVAVGQGSRRKAGHGCVGVRITRRGRTLLARRARTPIVIAVTFTPAAGGPPQRATRRSVIGRAAAS